MKCPDCGCLMTQWIDYFNGIPSIWYTCFVCNYDTRKIRYTWSNKTN